MQVHQSEAVITINPATGEKLASYKMVTEEEAMRMAKRARAAFDRWRLTSVGERSDYLRKLAGALRAKKSEYAKMMTLEMGKPIVQSESEIEKCAWTAEHFADNIGKWLSDEQVKTDAVSSYVEFDPLGVILSVMPWNYPFWQVLRFAIPALAAGNTAMLRHSNSCPGSALYVEETFKNAGFPEGVFTAAITNHDTVAKLIASKEIAGVSLTGSTDAGRRIGELAGHNFKKVVLELGGSDPFIVLEDADVKEAAKVIADVDRDLHADAEKHAVKPDEPASVNPRLPDFLSRPVESGPRPSYFGTIIDREEESEGEIEDFDVPKDVVVPPGS